VRPLAYLLAGASEGTGMSGRVSRIWSRVLDQLLLKQRWENGSETRQWEFWKRPPKTRQEAAETGVREEANQEPDEDD
jgi:hypothetical protein